MEFKYEPILKTGHKHRKFITTRAKVHRGWIVRNVFFDKTEENKIYTVDSVFVPDPNHEWMIK
jgi:hypothetical protein